MECKSWPMHRIRSAYLCVMGAELPLVIYAHGRAAPVSSPHGGRSAAAADADAGRVGMPRLGPVLARAVCGPGLQLYVAARMVEALCGVGGGSRWGLPLPGLPPPVTQLHTSESAAEAAVMFVQVAAPVLLAGWTAAALSARRGSQCGLLELGSVHRIGMRTLQWAIPRLPAGDILPASADKRRPTPGQAAPDHDWDAVGAVALAAARLAYVAMCAGSRAAKARRLQELTPLAVALLHRTSSKTIVATDTLLVLNDALAGAHEAGACTAADTAAAWHAALGGGLLAALHTYLTWASRFGYGQVVPGLERQLAVAIEGAMLHTATPAPAPCWLALVVGVRCAYMCAWRKVHMLGQREAGDMLGGLCRVMHGCLMRSMQQAAQQQQQGDQLPPSTQQQQQQIDASMTACQHHAACLLVHWAPTLCSHYRDTLLNLVINGVGANLDSRFDQLLFSAIGLAAANCGREQCMAAGGSGAGGPPAGAAASAADAAAVAAAAQHAASWRHFLLHDMRALDLLVYVKTNAVRSLAGGHARTLLVLDALTLLAHALPCDMQAHMSTPQGHSPESQHLEGPDGGGSRRRLGSCTSAPLHQIAQSNVDRQQQCAYLRAVLEGGDSGSSGAAAATANQVVREAAGRLAGSTAVLPSPDTVAALMPTCGYPRCSDVELYASAARGEADTPALLACGRCRAVRYCSRACQRSHWDLCHKAECGNGAGARQQPFGAGWW